MFFLSLEVKAGVGNSFQNFELPIKKSNTILMQVGRYPSQSFLSMIGWATCLPACTLPVNMYFGGVALKGGGVTFKIQLSLAGFSTLPTPA